MPPNILIVRFSSIGDLVLTTPLLRAIRTRHPDARITFVVREDMADVLRTSPRIDKLVTWQRGSSLQHLADELRGEAWTHRLDLHCSLRSYRLRRLVGGHWSGYPKHRIRRKMLIMTHQALGGALEPVAERYFAAAQGLDVAPDGGPPEFFTTPDGEARADAFLRQHEIGQHRPLIALAPGAAHFTKRWPEYHWTMLIKRLRETHDIVILGGKAEEVIGGALSDAARGAAASAAGKFLHDVNGALLKRAQLFVGGDTGLLHLATAVGTPIVGIYGPTVEAFGFFPYHATAMAVQHQLRCRPCSTQGGPKCPLGHHNCLVNIEADEVKSAIDAILTSQGSNP